MSLDDPAARRMLFEGILQQIKQIPSAKDRQTRYRDRGSSRPQRKTDRLSKKDASALVSMLHMISST